MSFLTKSEAIQALCEGNDLKVQLRRQGVTKIIYFDGNHFRQRRLCNMHDPKFNLDLLDNACMMILIRKEEEALETVYEYRVRDIDTLGPNKVKFFDSHNEAMIFIKKNKGEYIIDKTITTQEKK